jgi:hypothetical protein
MTKLTVSLLLCSGEAQVGRSSRETPQMFLLLQLNLIEMQILSVLR